MLLFLFQSASVGQHKLQSRNPCRSCAYCLWTLESQSVNPRYEAASTVFEKVHFRVWATHWARGRTSRIFKNSLSLLKPAPSSRQNNFLRTDQQGVLPGCETNQLRWAEATIQQIYLQWSFSEDANMRLLQPFGNFLLTQIVFLALKKVIASEQTYPSVVLYSPSAVKREFTTTFWVEAFDIPTTEELHFLEIKFCCLGSIYSTCNHLSCPKHTTMIILQSSKRWMRRISKMDIIYDLFPWIMINIDLFSWTDPFSVKLMIISKHWSTWLMPWSHTCSASHVGTTSWFWWDSGEILSPWGHLDVPIIGALTDQKQLCLYKVRSQWALTLDKALLSLLFGHCLLFKFKK